MVPLGRLPDRDARHLFQSLRIHHGHRVIRLVGNLNLLAVGRKSEPLRYHPGRGMSQQLEIRERINENTSRILAVGPKGLAVWGDADAVADVARARHIEPAGFVGKLYSSYLLVRRKIHHCEPVKFAKGYEDPAGRAVGVRLDGHGAYSRAVVELKLPNRLLSLDIHDL